MAHKLRGRGPTERDIFRGLQSFRADPQAGMLALLWITERFACMKWMWPNVTDEFSELSITIWPIHDFRG